MINNTPELHTSVAEDKDDVTTWALPEGAIA